MKPRSWGRRLAHAISARDTTQREIAKAAGVTPQAVSKWLAGGDISHPSLLKISRILGVNWVWLRYGNEALAQSFHTYDDTATAQEAIKNEEIHRAFCARFGVYVFSYNPSTRLFSTSPALSHILGDISGPITRDQFYQLMHPDDALRIREFVSEIYLHQRKMLVTIFRLKRDTSIRLLFVAFPGEDESGEIDRIVVGIGNANNSDLMRLIEASTVG